MTAEEPKLPSNSHIITIVVVSLAISAIAGVLTLAACLFFNKEVNVALLTAFVSIVNFALGAIAGVLAKTYATPTNETQKAEIINTAANPVPTEPQ